MALIGDIEVPTIGASGLECLDDVAAVFFASPFGRDGRWIFLQPVGEIGLEPVATLENTSVKTQT